MTMMMSMTVAVVGDGDFGQLKNLEGWCVGRMIAIYMHVKDGTVNSYC